MKKRNAFVAGIAAAALFSSVYVFADVTPEDVLNDLHHANQMEIQMGRLAQAQSATEDVKSFGKALVSDHQDNDRKVIDAATKDGITLKSAAPGPIDTMSMKYLKSLSGNDFDKKFAQDMVNDHKKDIAKMEAAQKSPLPEDIRELVGNTLPTLHKHLEMAQKLSGQAS